MRLALVPAVVAVILAAGDVRASGTPEAAGDAPMDTLLKAGVEHIMNAHFEEGVAQFQDVVSRWPSDPAGYVLLAGAQWWQFARDPDETTFDEALLTALETAIKKAEAAAEAAPKDGRAQLYLGGSYGMRARFKVLRREWFGAARDGKKAVSHLERAIELEPTLYDAYLGLGMYQYYTAILPSYVKVAQVLLMVPRGDREVGLKQMQMAREKGWLADAEAQFFLVDIYMSYEKRFREAVQYAQDLGRRYPDNPYFPLVEGIVHIDHAGNYDRGIELLTDLRAKAESGQVMPAFAPDIALRSRYYLGKAHMWRRDFQEALDIFKGIQTEKPKDPKWLMPWVRFRTGQAYDLLDERMKAVTEYRAVVSGPEIGGLYTHARKCLDKPFTLEPGRLGETPPGSGRASP